MSPRPRVRVMLKLPQAGRVKTRLGREIGLVPAAWWMRHQTASLLRRLEDPRWHLELAVAPDRAGLEARVWPAHLPRLPQGRGDLGARMRRALEQAPPGPVLVVGGDIPGLGPRQVARALRALGDHEAVLGPAPDGGYWGIGFARRAPLPPGLFQGVRWSSAHARRDTLATMAGLRVAQVDLLRDVDSAADLRALRRPHGA